MRNDSLVALILIFVSFSFTSVGGGSSVLAGIQHQAVDVHHWMDANEFVRIFAISRAAPGPGSMLATLVGLEAGGLPGALVATICMFLPSSILAYAVMRAGNRYRGRKSHTILEEALAPIGSGLVLAGVLAIGRLTGAGITGWIVAIGAASSLWLRPRLHPMLVLVAGAALFVVLTEFLA